MQRSIRTYDDDRQETTDQTLFADAVQRLDDRMANGGEC